MLFYTHQLKLHTRTFAAANPVDLGCLDLLDEVGLLKTVDQAVGIIGDLDHPLADAPARGGRSATFAIAIDHLFICQTDLAAWAPVDRHLLFFRQPFFEELDKDPLGPFIVGRVSRIYHTLVVEGQSQLFHLATEGGGVLSGHILWFASSFNSVVLSREPKSIPTDREKHVFSLHPFEAGKYIRPGKGEGMADMQSRPGWIGKFDQYIFFLTVVKVNSVPVFHCKLLLLVYPTNFTIKAQSL